MYMNTKCWIGWQGVVILGKQKTVVKHVNFILNRLKYTEVQKKGLFHNF